jgi:hypothetical protein
MYRYIEMDIEIEIKRDRCKYRKRYEVIVA